MGCFIINLNAHRALNVWSCPMDSSAGRSFLFECLSGGRMKLRSLWDYKCPHGWTLVEFAHLQSLPGSKLAGVLVPCLVPANIKYTFK